MTAIHVRDVLDLADLPAEHRLHGILAQILQRAGTAPQPVSHDDLLWPASFHGLDQVDAYSRATPGLQRQILQQVNRSVLEEAWFIEKAGLAFAAKMVLLARNTQERMLYSLFAADEARHFAAISAWIPTPPTSSAFHALLAEAIRDADRAVLVVLIQVVLEGWGLKHYRRLAVHTTRPDLQILFEQILADEAFHHGTGALISGEQPMSASDNEQTIGYLERFLAMVRPGPLAVASAICERCSSDMTDTLTQLDARSHARTRLDVLYGLLSTHTLTPIRDTLHRRGCFEFREWT